jgi:hypothetical protein
MILRLVKRDPAWQMTLPLAAAIGIVAPLIHTHPARVDFMLLVAAMFTACWVQARPHVHATLFESALPIAGRDLFLTRTLSLLGMIWIPVLCGTATILLVTADGSRAVGMVENGALLTPVILLPHFMRVREISSSPWWSRFGWILIPSVGLFDWYFVPPVALLAPCGLVIAALLIRTWFAVPASLQVVSLETADPTAIPESVPAIPLGRTVFPWLPVLRSVFWRLPVVFFPLMVLQGMYGGWFSFFSIFVMQGTLDGRKRTRWLSGLPLSHAALLRITLVSAVVPLLAGLTIGMSISPVIQPAPMLDGPGLKSPLGLNVPLEFWQYAPNGDVPVIQTPWGETVHPASVQAAGFTFYNPYSIDRGNSLRVHDWQLERATEAVYGRSIPFPQYIAAWKAGLKPRTEGPLMRILTLEAVALLGLFLVFACELTMWHRLNLKKAVRP